jgi:hypothetical protein
MKKEDDEKLHPGRLAEGTAEPCMKVKMQL